MVSVCGDCVADISKADAGGGRLRSVAGHDQQNSLGLRPNVVGVPGKPICCQHPVGDFHTKVQRDKLVGCGIDGNKVETAVL